MERARAVLGEVGGSDFQYLNFSECITADSAYPARCISSKIGRQLGDLDGRNERSGGTGHVNLQSVLGGDASCSLHTEEAVMRDEGHTSIRQVST